MKKLIALFAIGVLSLAQAAAQTVWPVANDVVISMYNGMGNTNRYVEADKTGRLQFLMYGQDPSPGAPVGQLRPQRRVFGPSIVCGNTFDSTCDVVAQAASVTSTQITDATATGRSLLTSTNAGAARTLIGASDGTYASLTGVPATFPPSAHTHTASQITDATGAGRAILTATDASAVRSLIGVMAAPSGTAVQYLDGTGAPRAFNRAVATTATDGTYTWTLPIACAAGQVPAVSVTPQNGTANEVINHKLTSVTNTTVTLTLSRAILTLNALLGLTIPVIQTSPGAQVVHLIAIC